MLLQAYFDDSGNQSDPFMAMAGLVATAQQVADLAGDWERWLRATTPGKIAYFKMDEAIHLYGEFQHWSEENRDAKIRQMANVIDREDLYLLGAVLDVEAHDRILRRVWKRKKGDNRHSLVHPYMMLCDEVLAGAVKYGIDHKVNERMHVCYDDNARYRPMFCRCVQRLCGESRRRARLGCGDAFSANLQR